MAGFYTPVTNLGMKSWGGWGGGETPTRKAVDQTTLKTAVPVNSGSLDFRNLPDNSSPIGRLIPVGYGSGVFPGEIVWWSGFKSETEPICDFIMRFKDGPGKLQWLKMDDGYVYRSIAPLRTPDFHYTVHDGSQTEPHAVLLAAVDEDEATAWPGHCDIAFMDFDCTDWGDRIPIVTGLWMTNPGYASWETEFAVFTSPQPDSSVHWTREKFAIDRLNRRWYQFSGGVLDNITEDHVDGGPPTLHVFDLDTMVELSRVPVTRDGSDLIRVGAPLALEGSDLILVRCSEVGSVTDHTLGLLDIRTGSVVGAPVSASYGLDPREAIRLGSGKYAAFSSGHGASGGVSDATGLLIDTGVRSIDVVFGPADPLAGKALETGCTVAEVFLGPHVGEDASFFWTEKIGGTRTTKLHRATIGGGYSLAWTAASTAKAPSGGWNCNADGSIVVLSDDGTLTKLNGAGATVWTRSLGVTGANVEGVRWFGTEDGNARYWTLPENQGMALWGSDPYYVDLLTGDSQPDPNQFGSTQSFYVNLVDGYYAYPYGNAAPSPGMWLKGRPAAFGDGDEVNLTMIYTALVTRSGKFTSADLAFHNFPGYECRGLTINTDTTIEDLERQISEGFDVKIVESGGKRHYFYPQRDDYLVLDGVLDPIMDVLEAGAYSIEKLTEADQEPLAVCTVSYYDVDADYRKLEQRYARPIGVWDVTDSRRERSIVLPLAMTAQQALRLATEAVYRSDIGAESYRLTLMPRAIRYEPAAVIQFEYDGFQIVGQIRSATLDGDSFTQTIEVTQYLVAAEATHTPTQLTVAPVRTITAASYVVNMLYLDIPLIEDFDDFAGAGLRQYAVLYGKKGVDWLGSDFYRSYDDSTYEELATRDDISPVVGTVTSIAGAPGNVPPEAVDAAGSLGILLTSGDMERLASVSEAEMLAGSRLAAVGAAGRWVIVGWQTSTSGSEYTTTLTDLVWGAKGTEPFISQLQVGDAFVLLDPALLQSWRNTVGSLDTMVYYKAGNAIYDEVDLAAQGYTATGVAEKPYAPMDLDLTMAGPDIRMFWVNRSRKGHTSILAEPAGSDIGETSLAFEVDVYDGAVFKRTLSATARSVIYTQADYTTDFGGLPAELTFVVHQMSVTVGRGYGSSMTTEVAYSGSYLMSGDEQTGTDAVLLEGDEQTGTDKIILEGGI